MQDPDLQLRLHSPAQGHKWSHESSLGTLEDSLCIHQPRLVNKETSTELTVCLQADRHHNKPPHHVTRVDVHVPESEPGATCSDTHTHTCAQRGVWL